MAVHGARSGIMGGVEHRAHGYSASKAEFFPRVGVEVDGDLAIFDLCGAYSLLSQRKNTMIKQARGGEARSLG